jgi:hypothetical protein
MRDELLCNQGRTQTGDFSSHSRQKFSSSSETSSVPMLLVRNAYMGDNKQSQAQCRLLRHGKQLFLYLPLCVPAPSAACRAAASVIVIAVLGIRAVYVILILSPRRARGVQAQAVLHAQGYAAQGWHQVHRQRQLGT